MGVNIKAIVSQNFDSPDNHLISDTTVQNVTLFVLHFNVVEVLS